MKWRNIILVAVTAWALNSCKNDDEPTDSIDEIVTDNALASIYFHTIFREAENAWAIVHSKDYSTEPFEMDKGKKVITYSYPEGGKPTITIDYNVWPSDAAASFTLMNTITVTIPDKDVYLHADKTATARLTNFSISGQRINGTTVFTYRQSTAADDKKDHYDYSLSGGGIYEPGDKLKLITADVTNGKYIRIEGGGTVQQNDDIWAYTGTMKGILREDPSLAYTNTILENEKYIVDDKEEDGTVNFSWKCMVAQKGLSQIIIPNKPEIFYFYKCETWDILTLTEN